MAGAHGELLPRTVPGIRDAALGHHAELRAVRVGALLVPVPVSRDDRAEADHGPGAPRLWVRTCARQTVLAFSPETVALVDASGRPVVSSSSIQSVSFVGSALHS